MKESRLKKDDFFCDARFEITQDFWFTKHKK